MAAPRAPPWAADIAFIHIPKNAGTTIENWALERGLKWGQHAWNGTEPIPTHSRATRYGATKYMCSGASWHIQPAVLNASGLPNPYAAARARFCVVRDPIARAVSAVGWEVAWQRSHRAGREAPLPCTRTTLNNHLRRQLYGVGPSSAVRAFPRLDVSGAHDRTCHYWPQWTFILNARGHGRACEHALRYDHLAEDFAALMRSLGRPELADAAMDPVRGLSSTRDNAAGDAECSFSRRDLDATTLAALRRVYAADFWLVANPGASAAELWKAFGRAAGH